MVPESGVLFLVLPTRCVNSKHVGGIHHFTGLLRGLGLRDLCPVRNTPKLTFFIIGNGGTATTAADKTVSVDDVSSATQPNRDANKPKVLLKSSGKQKKTAAPVPQWVEQVQKCIADHMKVTVFRHFTKDYSEAQANEFALALPDAVVNGLRVSE